VQAFRFEARYPQEIPPLRNSSKGQSLLLPTMSNHSIDLPDRMNELSEFAAASSRSADRFGLAGREKERKERKKEGKKEKQPLSLNTQSTAGPPHSRTQLLFLFLRPCLFFSPLSIWAAPHMHCTAVLKWMACQGDQATRESSLPRNHRRRQTEIQEGKRSSHT